MYDLIITTKTLSLPKGVSAKQHLYLEDIRDFISSLSFLQSLFRHRIVAVLVPSLDAFPRPAVLALIARALTAKHCMFLDIAGRKKRITIGHIIRRFGAYVRDWFAQGHLMRQITKDLTELERSVSTSRSELVINNPPSVLCLRTDLWYGIQAGGSVSHTSGVVNAFDQLGWKTRLVSVENIPSVERSVSQMTWRNELPFWDFPEIPHIASNGQFLKDIDAHIADCRPAFLYQRYSLMNYTGVLAAKRHNIPLVLEYNGSEVWIARNWGRPLRHEALAKRIERVNINNADLIVVVSQVMAETIFAEGGARGKVITLPNGVDENRFSSLPDNGLTRNELSLNASHIVIGFVGSFSVWHGTDVLVEAITKLMMRRKDLKNKLRLLFVGEGPHRPLVQQKLAASGLGSVAIFTSLVPPEKIPGILSACDILTAPHVPNPDGTPFFGSPVKLFEYMASGRAIAASSLGQIGEILDHEKDALLSEPGNSEDLSNNLERLVDNPSLREALGKSARKKVLSAYSWENHVKKIICSLKKRNKFSAR